jgi:C-terminal processing protease CtpA/Prc
MQEVDPVQFSSVQLQPQKASGYIRIATFSDNTTEGMLAALQKV